MKNPPVLTFLVIGVLILTGCLLILAKHPTVTISPSIPFYSPMMSSAVGIGLTPRYSGPPSGSLQYHWTADYGTFVKWGPPDYTVTDLGRDPITANGTVYWQYIPEIHGEEPAEVLLGLSVEDARTGKVLASSEKTLTRRCMGYVMTGMVDPGFVHPIPW